MKSDGPDLPSSRRMWRDSNDAVMRAAAESRDFDFVTESPSSHPPASPFAKIPESPDVVFARTSNDGGGLRVSFHENDNDDEVLACSSNSSFRRKSSLLRTRTKSRLLDPPEDNRRSQALRLGNRSQPLRGTVNPSEIDEDDPFLEEDLPEHYKKMRFGFLSVIQLLSLALLVAALACSLAITLLRSKKVFDLELWKWEAMALVLICGRLLSGWGVRIVVFFIERNFLLRKRVLYFVYGLRNSVKNVCWLAMVFVAWQLIFDKRVARVAEGRRILPCITRIWACLLVGTVIWLLKTLLVKVLASSFHVSAFFDRIQESLFNQYVIETLSGPPLIEIEEDKVMVEVQKLQKSGAHVPRDLSANMFPKKSTASASPAFSRLMSKKGEENAITIDHLHRMNQKNVSAWNMKRLMKIVRNGVLSTLDEKLRGSTGEDDEATVCITSENRAKSAAKKIFNNAAKPGSKCIQLEDLIRFMREDEAFKAMSLFEDGRDVKGISKRALKNWLVNAFRERRALALSLDDTKTAVNKLHNMLNVMVGVLIVVVWLLILKVATTQFFIFLSSQLLLVAFMFGNTCKTTFEAIVFLFVVHPFDVGDRVEVDGVQMIVEEMNILATVFLRYDNNKIYYPNSVLATKPIQNYYRSPDMGDAIDFCVHVSTPGEKIALMKERIIRYVDSKSDHWYPSPLIVMRDIEDMNRMKFSVWLSHRMNHQDMGERWSRRALLLEEMVNAFRELDIEYRLLPQDVNVRTMTPPLNSMRLPSNWTACAS